MMSVVAVEQPPLQHASKFYIDLEEKHGAFNYAPMPVVLSRGEGAKVLNSPKRKQLSWC